MIIFRKNQMTLCLTLLVFIVFPTSITASSTSRYQMSPQQLRFMEATYKIPTGLLTAICHLESRCNDLISPAKELRRRDHAYGPFQIRRIAYKQALRELKVNGHKNISLFVTSDAALASIYLQYLRRKCGSWRRAVSAYNTGGCYQNTQYVRRVIARGVSL